MDEIVDFIRFFWPFLLSIILVIGFLIGVGLTLNPYLCQSRWEGTYKTEWGVFSGCRVNINGKLVPERNVRELF